MAKKSTPRPHKVTAKERAGFDKIDSQLKKNERWVTVNGRHMIVKKDGKR